MTLDFAVSPTQTGRCTCRGGHAQAGSAFTLEEIRATRNGFIGRLRGTRSDNEGRHPMRLAAILAALLALPAWSQAPTYGCDTPESKQLDFWVGTWELGYTGPDGKPARSRNRITKVLDGCAVLEEFDGGEGTKLVGRSYSVFDRATKRWKQTWVDNTASYLDFDGTTVEGDMAFARIARRADGKTMHHRMVFRDVMADSLKWLWQASPDGQAWTTQWEIDYRRVSDAQNGVRHQLSEGGTPPIG